MLSLPILSLLRKAPENHWSPLFFTSVEELQHTGASYYLIDLLMSSSAVWYLWSEENEIFPQVLSAPRDESYEQANRQDVASWPIIHLLFNTQESSPEKLLP